MICPVCGEPVIEKAYQKVVEFRVEGDDLVETQDQTTTYECPFGHEHQQRSNGRV